MQFGCPCNRMLSSCSRAHCDGVAIFGLQKSDHFEYSAPYLHIAAAFSFSIPTTKTSLFMHLLRILDAFPLAPTSTIAPSVVRSFCGWTSLFSHKRQNKQLAAKVLIVAVHTHTHTHIWQIECVEYLPFHLSSKLLHTISIRSFFSSVLRLVLLFLIGICRNRKSIAFAGGYIKICNSHARARVCVFRFGSLVDVVGTTYVRWNRLIPHQIHSIGILFADAEWSAD